MPRLSLLLVAVILTLSGPARAADQLQWLLSQVRQGEALYRDDLVGNSLARLKLIAPDHPEVLLAALRLALRQQDLPHAEELAARLQQSAAGSRAARQAEVLLALERPEGQAALQQARLANLAGKGQEALALFDRLYGGEPPTLDLALEYWRLRSGLEGQRAQAIERLQALDDQYPGNLYLRQLLADLLFEAGRDAEALALIDQLATHSSSSLWAAQAEFEYLSDQPISEAVLARWQRFVERYPEGQLTRDAAKILAEQRRLLQDPHWRTGQHGLQLLEQGQPAQAEAKLRQALQHYPRQAAFLGGLGLALLRQEQRHEALDYFRQARLNEQDTGLVSKWRDLEQSAGYWLLLERADAQLEAGHPGDAEGFYREARQQDPRDVFPVLGLAKVDEALGRTDSAERHYRQAMALQPGNETALYGLLRLARAESEAKALAFLDGLPPKQRQLLQRQRDLLLLDQHKAEAARATEAGDLEGAIAALEQARRVDPSDPWVAYDLAKALLQLQRRDRADAVMRQLVEADGQAPEARFAEALYYSDLDRDGDALTSLGRIEPERWSEGMHALARRLERRQLLARAEQLRQAGREKAAIQLLEEAMQRNGRQPEDLRRLADWAQARGDHPQALTYLAEVLQQAPEDSEAQLMQIESWIAQARLDQARQALLELKPIDQQRPEDGRRMANAWAAVGETEHARALFRQLLTRLEGPDPLLRRDGARLIASEAPQEALDLYARAMSDAGALDAAAVIPRDDEALTRASRARAGDDWLVSSLRSDVERLALQQTTQVTVMHDRAWRNDDTTAGISEQRTDTDLVHIEGPVGQGRGFVQAERVALDAGRFETEADGLHREDFGSCQLTGQARDGSPVADGCRSERQASNGSLVGVGWQDERLSADIGFSQGFLLNDVYGGLGYEGDLGELGWSATVSRRPMTNSQLSLAGLEDPRTGIEWGGVTANGVTLGLSWDQGGPNGVWANLGQHWLRGTNVADNQRTSAMAGYYRKLRDDIDSRLRTGLTLMYLGYDKDLGGTSLGQGGYWSPQRYVSVGVPVSWAWRNADWSAALDASLSWSRSRNEASDRFPLASLNRQLASRFDLASSNLGERIDASSSSGFSYRLQGTLERRLSSHLVLGSGIDWLQSEDYAPSNASLYLRYSLSPWQGNLPLPVQPLERYGERR